MCTLHRLLPICRWYHIPEAYIAEGKKKKKMLLFECWRGRTREKEKKTVRIVVLHEPPAAMWKREGETCWPSQLALSRRPNFTTHSQCLQSIRLPTVSRVAALRLGLLHQHHLLLEIGRGCVNWSGAGLTNSVTNQLIITIESRVFPPSAGDPAADVKVARVGWQKKNIFVSNRWYRPLRPNLESPR